MPNDNDDLLETYDDNDGSEYDYFQESQENASNLAYSFLMLGFLVIIGIKFFQSLFDTGPDQNAIIVRQVQLLKIIKNSQDDDERNTAIIEYDSLANVLDRLE